MNEYLKEVDDAISNINEEIDRATIKSYLKKFESTGRFDKFEERFEDFRQDERAARRLLSRNQ
ncbi:MAG: hypothetical protein MZV65_46390 [Chromatiales bacterium]|nr:hypothetical protein [Chromatiales bacterium]MCK7582302.1 hypothetical protein [Chromatiales bacterium]